MTPIRIGAPIAALLIFSLPACGASARHPDDPARSAAGRGRQHRRRQRPSRRPRLRHLRPWLPGKASAPATSAGGWRRAGGIAPQPKNLIVVLARRARDRLSRPDYARSPAARRPTRRHQEPAQLSMLWRSRRSSRCRAGLDRRSPSGAGLSGLRPIRGRFLFVALRRIISALRSSSPAAPSGVIGAGPYSRGSSPFRRCRSPADPADRRLAESGVQAPGSAVGDDYADMFGWPN